MDREYNKQVNDSVYNCLNAEMPKQLCSNCNRYAHERYKQIEDVHITDQPFEVDYIIRCKWCGYKKHLTFAFDPTTISFSLNKVEDIGF